jgi:hypothetical protein
MSVNLNDYLEVDDKSIRLAQRQGQVDGAAEMPPASAAALSDWEQRFTEDARSAWKRYSSAVDTERQNILEQYHRASDQVERSRSKSEESLGEKQRKALEFLDFEVGESSAIYKDLKGKHNEAQDEYQAIKDQLNRPAEAAMVRGYFPLMLLLAVAEIPVNRLAFELYFESMPAISLILSGAVGSLLIFFAHIIGKQAKRTRCPITATNNGNVYLAITGLVLLCLIVMIFLGVMREQVVALQASAANFSLESLKLEDLTNDGGASRDFSWSMGSAALFLVVLNFAIFLSGVVAAYIRHDSHPFFEQLEANLKAAEGKFRAHKTMFETKQITLMKEFAAQMATSDDQHERQIREIEAFGQRREALDAEYAKSRVAALNFLTKAIQTYRKENMLARKTPPPEYFTARVELIAREIFA